MTVKAEWRYVPLTREWVLSEWAKDGAPVDVLGSVSATSLTAIAPALRQRISMSMLEQHGIRPPACVFDGPPGEEITLTCPACWSVSYDPERARSRVCGNCPGVSAVVPHQRVEAEGLDARAGGA